MSAPKSARMRDSIIRAKQLRDTLPTLAERHAGRMALTREQRARHDAQFWEDIDAN